MTGGLLERGVVVLQRVHRQVEVHGDDEGVGLGLSGETFASEGRAWDCLHWMVIDTKTWI